MVEELHFVAQFLGRKKHCLLFATVSTDPESETQSFQLTTHEVVPELRGNLREGALYWIEKTPQYYNCVEEVPDSW